jgi:hypothetical protein
MMPSGFVLSQSSSAARNGSGLASKAQAGGWYPLLVLGGIVVLVAVFAFIVRMRRDS